MNKYLFFIVMLFFFAKGWAETSNKLHEEWWWKCANCGTQHIKPLDFCSKCKCPYLHLYKTYYEEFDADDEIAEIFGDSSDKQTQSSSSE